MNVTVTPIIWLFNQTWSHCTYNSTTSSCDETPNTCGLLLCTEININSCSVTRERCVHLRKCWDPSMRSSVSVSLLPYWSTGDCALVARVVHVHFWEPLGSSQRKTRWKRRPCREVFWVCCRNIEILTDAKNATNHLILSVNPVPRKTALGDINLFVYWFATKLCVFPCFCGFVSKILNCSICCT